MRFPGEQLLETTVAAIVHDRLRETCRGVELATRDKSQLQRKEAQQEEFP